MNLDEYYFNQNPISIKENFEKIAKYPQQNFFFSEIC